MLCFDEVERKEMKENGRERDLGRADEGDGLVIVVDAMVPGVPVRRDGDAVPEVPAIRGEEPIGEEVLLCMTDVLLPAALEPIAVVTLLRMAVVVGDVPVCNAGDLDGEIALLNAGDLEATALREKSLADGRVVSPVLKVLASVEPGEKCIDDLFDCLADLVFGVVAPTWSKKSSFELIDQVSCGSGS